MRKQLQSFLAALQADDAAAFLETVEDYVAGQEGADLNELLQSTPRKDTVTICEGLFHQAQLAAARFDAAAQEDAVANGEEEDNPERDTASQVLLAVTIVSKLVFDETAASPPAALLHAAVVLHDSALLAAAEYPALQEEVAKLCVDWWQTELPGREQLTTQTVPYLLVAALQSGTAAAVKRCHAVRTALELFDFEDPSIGDLKRLLLRAAFAPSFLRASEGRRFLAFLFTLEPAFARELAAIVRNQIPAGRKSVLDAYGEVLYRAWAGAQGACLLEVQQGCIQGLMEAAILASTPAMAVALRRVLGGLHCQKHQPGVDALLLQLYEPILFRGMKAANADVRRNAFQLFVEAFPLRDPDEPNELTDRRMAEQFSALSAALKDDVPVVRAAAVAGVCRILDTYWEVIPGAVTAGYVKEMAGALAFDAASPAVRAAVAQGLTSLVDNALAQPLLKAVLPKLEPLLYDASAKVRVAFADLLLALRGVRALRWHDVVGVQHLLEVMAGDSPAVSERIQRLLLPSYFPDLATGPALVAALLRASPAAGRAFCLYLAGVHQPPTGGVATAASAPAGPAVSADALAALARDLALHLLDVPLATAADLAGAAKGGKKPRTKRRKGRSAGDEEGQEEQVEVIETMQSWEGILGGLAAVCVGLGAIAKTDASYARVIGKLFAADALPRLLERCRGAAARCELARIAAALPAAPGVATVRSALLLPLFNEEDACPDEVLCALECACAEPHARAALLRAIAAAFGADPQEVLPTGEVPAVPADAPIGKGRRKQTIALPDPEHQLSQGAAVRYIGGLLQLDGPRQYLLSSGALARLLPWLGAALEARVEALLAGDATDEGDGGACTAMPTYLRACMHLFLGASTEAGGEAAESAQSQSMPARGAALQGMQQALEWGKALLQHLAQADGASIAAALNLVPPAQPPKRTKAAKARAAAAATPALSPAAAALRDAFATAQACVALLAEAARLQVVGWTSPGASPTCGLAAARTGQLLLGVVHSVSEAAAAADSGLDVDAVVAASVSHSARLARNLATGLGVKPAEASRDLQSELQQAAQGGPHAEGGATAAVGSLAAALLSAMCEQGTAPAACAAAKPHFTALVAGLAIAPSPCGDAHWLQPLARVLGAAVDARDVPPVQLEDPAAPTTQDENSSAAANRSAAHGAIDGEGKAAGAIDGLQILSDAADHAAVKLLVVAAQQGRVQQPLAGQAAEVALAAWKRGDVEAAVGAVELAQLLGFKGVTVRGRNKAGGDGHAAAMQSLRAVHAGIALLAPADLAAPHTALLHHKLHALFPPAPRVTFLREQSA